MTTRRLVVAMSAAILVTSGATMVHAGQVAVTASPPDPLTTWAWSAPPGPRTDGGVGHPGSARHRYVAPTGPGTAGADGSTDPAGPTDGSGSRDGSGSGDRSDSDGSDVPGTGGAAAPAGPRQPGSPPEAVVPGTPGPGSTGTGTPGPGHTGSDGHATGGSGDGPADDDPAARDPESTSSGRSGGGAAALDRSVPIRLDIPAIGVRTSLIKLGLNSDNTVQVPPLRRNAPAGWYSGMVTPGERGPAVILGHVDTAEDGPAVFYDLDELRPGDTISVRRADGRAAVFTVQRTAQYPKRKFPTDSVYGPIDHAGLRLVTCAGTFDRARGSYRDVVVVYARLSHHTGPPAPVRRPDDPAPRSGRQKWI